MIRMKKLMKRVSRVMVLNMIWITCAAVPAGAEPVQTAMNPENYSKSNDFQERSDHEVPVDFPGIPVMGSNVHWAVLEATQNYPQVEDRKFPEKNTVLGNARNVGGFILTYSTVLAGYLVLYVPLGSYGAVKCVFDDEGWNDCWNGYMNRTFH